jgi:hypothetical protein
LFILLDLHWTLDTISKLLPVMAGLQDAPSDSSLLVKPVSPITPKVEMANITQRILWRWWSVTCRLPLCPLFIHSSGGRQPACYKATSASLWRDPRDEDPPALPAVGGREPPQGFIGLYLCLTSWPWLPERPNQSLPAQQLSDAWPTEIEKEMLIVILSC